MPRFLLSLDEIDRVKRINGIRGFTDFEEKTGVHRNTWSRAISERKPTEAVLQALATLGARGNHILILEPDIAGQVA